MTSTSQQPPNSSQDSATAASGDINLFTGLRILLPFSRYQWPGFVAAALLASISSLAMLGPFWVIYRAADDIVAGEATREGLYEYALLAAGFIVAQYLLRAAADWTSHRAAFATLEQLRLRVGRRFGQVPLGFLTARRSGAVQRTMSTDIERLELFLAHVIPDAVAALTSMVFIVVWLFLVNWLMALVSLSVVVIALPIMSVGMSRGSGKLAEYTRSMARMNASMVEFIRAIPVVRTFNGTRRIFGETKAAINHAAEYEAQWGREFLPLFTVFFVLVTSPVLTILPFGLLLWHIGLIGTSTLLFFFIVGLGYTVPLLRILGLMAQFAHLGLGARLVRELDQAETLPEHPENAHIEGARVEVSGVCFSYPADDGSLRRVLNDVTFTGEPGTVTAIVGPSGAGKSTLARLLARFWDVDEGSIHIGGVDIREMPMAQLMDQVAFVFQETFLFNDSVAANLPLPSRMRRTTRLLPPQRQLGPTSSFQGCPKATAPPSANSGHGSPAVNVSVWQWRVLCLRMLQSSYWMKQPRLPTPRTKWHCRQP